MENEVTLDEMLASRENRVSKQSDLIRMHNAPVICFTMNIAGPVKNSRLIQRAFMTGCNQLRYQFTANKLTVLYSDEDAESKTGPCAFYCVDCNALTLKKMTTDIEDYLPVGRLFDMDVIGTDGLKLDRELVSGNPRNCIVCGKEGKGCASRRVHSVEELQNATKTLLEKALFDMDAEKISSLAVNALIEEVLVTPKPGLVDFNNSGSHQDMDYHLFIKSALTLKPYFEQCFKIGYTTKKENPVDVFDLLNKEGKKAEIAMFEATYGINTHKGAIFSLGIIVAAMGRLYQPDKLPTDPNELASMVKELSKDKMEQQLAEMKNASGNISHGVQIYQQYGIEGIRGEMKNGLSSILNISLPAYENLLRCNDDNDALAKTLIFLIAATDDTNMIYRGGVDLAMQMKEAAKEYIGNDRNLAELDALFIEKNVSPGGCADLLAITWFMHKMRSLM